MFDRASLRLRALAVVVAIAALAPAAALAQTTLDGPGRFFLSWNAPHGHPRARAERSVACDSTRKDTLYLSFDPGRDSTELIAVDAEVRIHPAPGDTLLRHWWFESRSNPAHLKADFNVGDIPGIAAIWTQPGNGGVRTVSGPDTAFVRMVWAVRPQDAAMVYGKRTYVFARLIVPRPGNAEVCAKPVCFELRYGRLGRGIAKTDYVTEGRRWVSWNPGGTAPCADHVRQSRLPSWRPPVRSR